MRRLPEQKGTDTLFPYTTLFRAGEHCPAAHHAKRLAHMHDARGLGAFAANLDLAGLDRLPGQAAGLVEPRGPEPQVEPDARTRHARAGACAAGLRIAQSIAATRENNHGRHFIASVLAGIVMPAFCPTPRAGRMPAGDDASRRSEEPPSELPSPMR